MISRYYDQIMAAGNILDNAHDLAPLTIKDGIHLTNNDLMAMFVGVLDAIPEEIRKAIQEKISIPFSITNIDISEINNALIEMFSGKMDLRFTKGFEVEPDTYPEDIIPMMFNYYGNDIVLMPDLLVLHLFNIFSSEIEMYQNEGELYVKGMEMSEVALLAITLSPFVPSPVIYPCEMVEDRPLAYMASYWINILENPILGVTEGGSIFIDWKEWDQFQEWLTQADEVFKIVEWVQISTQYDLICGVLKEIPLEVENVVLT